MTYRVVVRSKYGDELIEQGIPYEEVEQVLRDTQKDITRPGFEALVLPDPEDMPPATPKPEPQKETKKKMANKNTAVLEALDVEIEETEDKLERLKKMRTLYTGDQQEEAPKRKRRSNGAASTEVSGDAGPADGQ